MRFQKLLVFSLAVWPVVAQSQQQPAGALPSLADLQKLNFESAASPKLSGAPSYADLQTAIHSFQMFHSGSSEMAAWKSNEPPKTRGLRGTQVYNQAVNAVVYIMAATEPPSNGTVHVKKGAGAILAPDDLVLTNWHVTGEACLGNYPILVYLKPARGVDPLDNLAYSAHVEYYNDTKDMSLLRFDTPPPHQLAKLKLAPMSSIVVGQDVHVIGHPRGETWSYSTGVVSQIRTNYKTVFHDESGKGDRPFEANVLQLQTAISPGNSGGPVLDNYASIIGLISFNRSDAQNLDYAISVDEIDSFLRRHDAKMGIGSKPSVSPQAEYSVAPSSGGRKVIKVQYPDRTAYLIVDADGNVLSVVADGGNGASVQAWQPAATGGFQQWRATFRDGKTAEGSGQNGQPTRFVIGKK